MISGMIAMLFYVGSYTTAEKPNGLACVDFDATTGRLRLVKTYAVDNPLYLAKSADGKILYMNEADGLGSFAIGAGGELMRIDAVHFGVKSMCHLAPMPGDTALTWASYSSGVAGLIGVRDGRFLAEIRRDQHVGRGPDPRQGSAHCHAAVPTPDGEHYTVVDLAKDELVTYSARDAKATGVVTKTAPLGAGPRHLLFHPDGRHAFVVFELGSRIGLYSFDEKGAFHELDNRSTLPAEWKGLNQDAAIRFTPDMKSVVVSNRGYDSLTVFDFDLAKGRLTLKNRTILPGDWPRDFLFVSGTDYALVAMERSNTLLSARYDAASGAFTPIDSLHGFHRPVAILPACRGATLLRGEGEMW